VPHSHAEDIRQIKPFHGKHSPYAGCLFAYSPIPYVLWTLHWDDREAWRRARRTGCAAATPSRAGVAHCQHDVPPAGGAMLVRRHWTTDVRNRGDRERKWKRSSV